MKILKSFLLYQVHAQNEPTTKTATTTIATTTTTTTTTATTTVEPAITADTEAHRAKLQNATPSSKYKGQINCR